MRVFFLDADHPDNPAIGRGTTLDRRRHLGRALVGSSRASLEAEREARRREGGGNAAGAGLRGIREGRREGAVGKKDTGLEEGAAVAQSGAATPPGATAGGKMAMTEPATATKATTTLSKRRKGQRPRRLRRQQRGGGDAPPPLLPMGGAAPKTVGQAAAAPDVQRKGERRRENG